MQSGSPKRPLQPLRQFCGPTSAVCWRCAVLLHMRVLSGLPTPCVVFLTASRLHALCVCSAVVPGLPGLHDALQCL